MARPTLSVLMTNYNHGQYLSEQLHAILSQSYSPKEILIIDDASTDNSVEILERIARKAPNLIKISLNTSNMGPFYNSNRLFESSSGDYIYWASADDKALPGLFSRSMELLSKYPDAGLCSAGAYIINENGETIGKFRPYKSGAGFIPPQTVAYKLCRYWYSQNPFFSPSMIFRRAPLLEVLPFPLNLGPCADVFIFTSILLKFGLCYINEPLSAWRFTQRNFSQSVKSPDKIAEYFSNALIWMGSVPDGVVFPTPFIALIERETIYNRQRSALDRLKEAQKAFLAEVRSSTSRTTLRDRVALMVLGWVLQVQSSISKFILNIRRVNHHLVIRKVRNFFKRPRITN